MKAIFSDMVIEGTPGEIVEFFMKSQRAQTIKNLSDIKIEITELPKDPPQEEENHG